MNFISRILIWYWLVTSYLPINCWKMLQPPIFSVLFSILDFAYFVCFFSSSSYKSDPHPRSSSASRHSFRNFTNTAKGRTNIELREQFILADGVSQTMTAFKPKTSASSPASGSSASSLRTPQGPITKVLHHVKHWYGSLLKEKEICSMLLNGQ